MLTDRKKRLVMRVSSHSTLLFLCVHWVLLQQTGNFSKIQIYQPTMLKCMLSTVFKEQCIEVQEQLSL